MPGRFKVITWLQANSCIGLRKAAIYRLLHYVQYLRVLDIVECINLPLYGHGTPTEMSAEQALKVAKSVAPTTAQGVDANDPLKLEVGMDISIAPDENSGEQPVSGKLHFADSETIGLLQTNEQVGTVCINFPRVGYRITTG